MLIKDLVEYCDDNYDRPQRCQDCPNEECPGDCEQCLKIIHFPDDYPDLRDRGYHCDNIVNFYVCKYIYKYSSEIDRLIENHTELNDLNHYKILSLGCGPCSDLVGVLNYIDRSNLERSVDYIGIDMNNRWKQIHSRIEEIIPQHVVNVRVTFRYGDALTMIRRLNMKNIVWKPNILIMHYLISDLVNAGENIPNFLSDLFDSVITYMPIDSYIIINDINHRKVRNHFSSLIQKMRANFNIDFTTYHFKNNNARYTYPYGNRHPDNSLTSAVHRHLGMNYNPWEFCSSAQMVIRRIS